jgi:hypothetical protein
MSGLIGKINGSGRSTLVIRLLDRGHHCHEALHSKENDQRTYLTEGTGSALLPLKFRRHCHEKQLILIDLMMFTFP